MRGFARLFAPLFALSMLLTIAPDAQAKLFGRRCRGCNNTASGSYSYQARGSYRYSTNQPTYPQAAPAPCQQCPVGAPCPQAPAQPAQPQPERLGCSDAVDALHLVNEQRAAAGLRPYILCEWLQAAARSTAAHKAKWHCAGHCGELPAAMPVNSPVMAKSAGADGSPLYPGDPFLACNRLSNYTYAGAAYAADETGRLYTSLFVR